MGRGQFVASKTKAALDGGLGAIVCCGESLEVRVCVCREGDNCWGNGEVQERCVELTGRQQREANKTIEVVTSQLKAVAERVQDWSKIVIAYEPIWYVRTDGRTDFSSLLRCTAVERDRC